MKPAWDIAEERRQLKIFEERAAALHKLADDRRQNVFDFLARVTQEKIWLLTIVERVPKEAKTKDKRWFRIGKKKAS